MARLAPDPALVATAAQAIVTSPGCVRVSLTVGNDHLREAAILELASSVVDSIQARRRFTRQINFALLYDVQIRATPELIQMDRTDWTER